MTPSINAPPIALHPRLRLYAVEALRLALAMLLAAEVLIIAIVVLA